jgi:hypothetical protein
MKNGSFSVGAPLPGNELVSILEMLAKLKSWTDAILGTLFWIRFEIITLL